MKKIVIDTLGSDAGEEELLHGVILAHRKFPSYQFVLSGNREHCMDVLSKNGEKIEDYVFIDSPLLDPSIHDALSMLRFKGHCSMVDALDYARDNADVAGILSAGATGMLIVSALRHIGLLPGVYAPALAAMLYNIHRKYVCLVDCGANIDIREDRLLQFAQLGTALMRSYCGIESPRVGLMNVGKEDTKGDKLRLAAFPLFRESSLNFVGNIEGSDVFLDKVDVVACDGFSGNVILKNAEAVGLIGMKIAESNHEEKTAKQLYDMFAYNELGGAIILGSRKVIMKAHGAANRKSICSVIGDIIKLDENDFVENMKKELASNKQ